MNNDQIVKMLIEKMYDMVAKKEIERAMEKTRIIMGIAPENYEIVRLKNNIAKCVNKNIIINPDIVMYNRETIEYIVTHEFCHLKYKNHTKSFYDMLKSYIPNYEKLEEELNKISY